jgi:hypothetical protein
LETLSRILAPEHKRDGFSVVESEGGHGFPRYESARRIPITTKATMTRVIIFFRACAFSKFILSELEGLVELVKLEELVELVKLVELEGLVELVKLVELEELAELEGLEELEGLVELVDDIFFLNFIFFLI